MHLYSVVSAQSAENPINFVRKNGERTNHVDLINRISEARDGYWYWNMPPFYDGHSQTLMASREHSYAHKIYYGRRLFQWTDGATISVDYALPDPEPQQWAADVGFHPVEGLPKNPPRTRYFRASEVEHLDSKQETRPIIIHVHGLTGGSHESYIRSSIDNIRAYSNFDNCVITARGCNRTKLTTPQVFCVLWTDDLRKLVAHIHAKQPDRPIYAVGYSLGAAILTNYLGQEGDQCVVKGAVIISAPWDMSVTTVLLEESFIGRNFYIPHMAANLCKVLEGHQQMLLTSPYFKRQFEKHGGVKAKSIFEFDDRYTAGFFGFVSAFDYYRNASPVHRLGSVRVPTLILGSKDDPVCFDQAVPLIDAERNPYVHVARTSVGGHLGWFGMTGPRWHTAVIYKYFEALQTVKADKVEAVFDIPEKKYNGERLVFE